jgi:hypothetical protein
MNFRLAGLLLTLAAPVAAAPIPRLVLSPGPGRLLVDDQPFLIRGGELNNSSATNPEYLRPFWPQFHRLHLNTLIVPAYWDLLEPQEGRFDFSTIDGVIRQARENHMRLVLLWFGSWKNSQSCYVPAWVKTDPARFPRALDAGGHRLELLSPFSTANRAADAKAYGALLAHLRGADSTDRTVILVQVENEIGMIPSARDHSPAANAAFAAPVPAGLMDRLTSATAHLTPELQAAWQAAGGKRAGTWTEVFGSGDAAEEIFMAWHFATYTNAVTVAGKREYALPTYVNAALIRPGYRPGQYPSAGPLPHLFDVWRAGAPDVDLLSPDIYFTDFINWARRYDRPGNPLFIPESSRGSEASVNGLYAYGALHAIGFSVFGVDAMTEPAETRVAQSFDLVEQLQPTILARRATGEITAVLSQGPEEKQPFLGRLGGWTFHVTFEHGLPTDLPMGVVLTGDSAPDASPSGALIIATGPDEFLIAGTGIAVTFETGQPGTIAGLLSVEEGRYVGGQWRNTLWLSGDQTNQGREVRLPTGRFSIQRVRLYRY